MEITFGRYTDSFKPKKQADYWSESVKLFDDKKYLDSFRVFLKYISNSSDSNIKIKRDNDILVFEFMQGSKKVNVIIDNEKVFAVSNIAEITKLSVPLMRRILEMNFTLYYSRFILNENKISIIFDSYTEDCFPEKLYYALKELALKADKQDDLLTNEFSNALKIIDDSIIIQLPDNIKKLKFNYFKKWINESLQRMSELNPNNFDGAISYLNLSLLYRIEYLLRPEGAIVNDMEEINFKYFENNDKKLVEKNTDMQNRFKKMLEKSQDFLESSFYEVIATFSVLNPAFHTSVVETINSNINNVKWYVDNNYPDIAYNIYEYIAGYCFYHYGMPKPTAMLLQIVFRLLHPEFFYELGLTDVYFNKEQNKLNEELIKTKIFEIIKDGKEQFPDISFKIENLKFGSLLDFLSSFFNELKVMVYESQN